MATRFAQRTVCDCREVHDTLPQRVNGQRRKHESSRHTLCPQLVGRIGIHLRDRVLQLVSFRLRRLLNFLPGGFDLVVPARVNTMCQ